MQNSLIRVEIHLFLIKIASRKFQFIFCIIWFYPDTILLLFFIFLAIYNIKYSCADQKCMKMEVHFSIIIKDSFVCRARKRRREMKTTWLENPYMILTHKTCRLCIIVPCNPYTYSGFYGIQKMSYYTRKVECGLFLNTYFHRTSCLLFKKKRGDGNWNLFRW